MSKKLRNTRIQLLNEDSRDVLEDVNVLTSAECVEFEDGENAEAKNKAIQSKLSSHDGKIGKAEGRISANEGKIGKLEGRASSLETRTTNVENKANTNERNIKTKFDKAGGELTGEIKRFSGDSDATFAHIGHSVSDDTSWKIGYRGTTSSLAGNELEINSTNRAGAKYRVNHQGKMTIEKDGAHYNVYTSLNKPSPSELQAADRVHDHDGRYRPMSYTPTWSEVRDKPQTFPATTHEHPQYETTVTSTSKHASTLKSAQQYADKKVSDLIGTAPDTLNTLEELADALGRNDNFATTMTEELAGKAPKVHDHNTLYFTQSQINGFLGGKANTSHGTHVPSPQSANNATFLRNDNTWQKVTPANIGASPTAGSTSLNQLAENIKLGSGAAMSIAQNNGEWWQKLGTLDTSDKGAHRLYFSERQGSGDYVELFGVDGNGDLFAKGRKVYHTGYKPSASDINAADRVHKHSSADITSLSGYSKAGSATAITSGDSLNVALGKLEKALEGKVSNGSFAPSGHTHDDRYLKLTGGTTSGRIHADGKISTVSSGSTWISGKTTSNASLEIKTQVSQSAYHPMIAAKSHSGNVINFGGLGDRLGFFGYKASTSDNRTDWEFEFDTNTGNVTASGLVISRKGFNGTLNGNAASATKLANARSFTIGNTTRTFDGTGNASWSVGDIGAAPTNHSHSNYLPLTGGTITGRLDVRDTIKAYAYNGKGNNHAAITVDKIGGGCYGIGGNGQSMTIQYGQVVNMDGAWDASNQDIIHEFRGSLKNNGKSVTRKYVADFGSTSTGTYKIAHNLGTQDVSVTIREKSNNQIVYSDVACTDANNITITLGSNAPSSNAFRVVVIG